MRQHMEASSNHPGDNPLCRPMVPLRGVVVFPHIICRLTIGRPASLLAVEKSLAADGALFLAAQQDGTVEQPTADQFYQVGTLARITQHRYVSSTLMQVQIEGLQRAKLLAIDDTNSYWQATVQPINESFDLDSATRHLTHRFNLRIRESIEHADKEGGTKSFFEILMREDNTHRLVDSAAYYLNLNTADKQRLLETLPLHERILRIIEIVQTGPAKLWVNAHEGDDPSKRMQFAGWLVHEGDYDAALSEYLWCFDQQHQRSFYGVRLSFLLSYIVDLSRTYPPAIEALKQRRDALTEGVLSGQITFDQAADYVSINDRIGEGDRSLFVKEEEKMKQE